jgi:quinolinate synthase
MKLNTMQKLYLCLKYERPEIVMNQDIIDKARVPIEKMLEISRKAKLIN